MPPSSLQEAARQHTPVPVGLRWDTWRAWVLANLAAEALGLGATLLIGVLFLGAAESQFGIVPVALLAVILGAVCEGGIVGSLQWLVLRRPAPSIRWRAWVMATALGAGVAWALAMALVVVMSFMTMTAQSETNSTSQGFAMAEPVVLLLAALMGIALGAVLGTGQWTVLRKHVPRAGWWIPANAAAWAVGMALVFAGTSFIPDSGAVTPGIIIALVFFVALAGIAVGAIHGLALIALLRERDRALLISDAHARSAVSYDRSSAI
ncbi:MAG: hypothetical protein ACM3N4_02470 [Nitrososphaerota archaeon]